MTNSCFSPENRIELYKISFETPKSFYGIINKKEKIFKVRERIIEIPNN